MIRGLVVLVFLILLGPVAAKAQMPAGAAGYLDKGWREVMRAEGDLDKDGIDDWALILEAPDGETTPHNACREEDAWSQAPVRRLLIGFGGEGAAEAPVVDDATVVLRSDQGGVMGDPLAELRIERGALVIDYFGGSRFRWSETQRFRLQEGAFRLIGHTMSYSDSLSASVETYDYNPLTAKLSIEVEESEDAELRESDPVCVFCRIGEACPERNGCYAGSKRMATGSRIESVERRPLIALADFRCWEEDTGMMKYLGFEDGR